MNGFPWLEVTLASLGIAVPILVAFYEFVLVGRKRLGYRIQMDTTATEAVHSPHAGVLQRLQRTDGAALVDPSFVLLRIENNGSTPIDVGDYAVLDDDKVGIRVTFPERRVVGMVVTETSADFLRASFGDNSGLSVRDGVIELPKAPLNRGAHYKVLAALERVGDRPGDGADEFPAPQVVGGIKGGVGNGGIQETASRTGVSGQAVWLICFLVLIVLGQFVVSLDRDDTPIDCARGNLVLTGSTAFQAVVMDAAAAYQADCGDQARFDTRFEGSDIGLRDLEQAGVEADEEGAAPPEWVTFSDGPKGNGFPGLVSRPVAFSLFTIVVSPETQVRDLSLQDVRDLFAGRVATWRDVGGADLPVVLVGRESSSGTRRAFQREVLQAVEGAENSEDCRTLTPGAPPGVLRCRRESTTHVLETVAETPGAIGYSGVEEAMDRDDVVMVRIDDREAVLENADAGVYPFWATEFAYTYGEPPADSLTASFLRYLTNSAGQDIIRAHGHHTCDALRDRVRCQPLDPVATDGGVRGAAAGG
ncbi:substrate-binding domain-containing protein [Allostreptomyces psammosilenae]|uniref:ABC-type phosphate transport system substrate-binding protein n=1 Tax=Allostreptomyces psammosilenae TaxID=1892865 RepID=A0A853A9W4_9ACTN|nr:substrate-binding domain-containing protein [Allostreptomyces psammosilenae]NYI07182.1 ABC-type phosphate transport system substrate-binding protein [Allostreptomyces psammosilenae]